GLLRQTVLESLSHLGRYAFSEIGNAFVAPAMFVIQNLVPSSNNKTWACRLVAPRPSHEQAELLRLGVSNPDASFVFSIDQRAFLLLPLAPMPYWVPQELIDIIGNQRPMGKLAASVAGLITGDSPRFLRRTWEIQSLKIFRTLANGGGHKKWRGLENTLVQWRPGSSTIYQELGTTRNQDYYFSPGVYLTQFASGKLSA